MGLNIVQVLKLSVCEVFDIGVISAPYNDR